MLLKDAKDVRVGTTQAKGVYVGSTKVWPVATGAFDPATMSGCILGLQATDLSLGAVSTWTDRSSAHNNVVPVWGAPAAFDASSTRYVNCSTNHGLGTTYQMPVTGAAPRHMIGLVRTRDVAGSFMGYGATGTGQLFDLWNYNPGKLIWHGYGGGYDSVPGAPLLTPGEWHVIEATYDGSKVRIWVDGNGPGLQGGTDLLATPMSQFWFGTGRYSPAGDFDMAAFYFYDRVLSAGERTQVNDYLLALLAPPAFNPASLSGLTTWLDAADYVPGSWPDKSGAATPISIVGSPNMAWSPDTLNGKAVVRFKANEARVRSGWATDVHTYTLLYVVRQWGPTIGRAFSVQYPPSNYLVGFHAAGRDNMYDNGAWINWSGGGGQGWWATGTAPWRLYEVDSIVGTGARFFVDANYAGASNGSGGLTGGWALSGYSSTGAEETCDIDVAELLMWNRKLTDPERVQVEAYLKGKWGLP